MKLKSNRNMLFTCMVLEYCTNKELELIRSGRLGLTRILRKTMSHQSCFSKAAEIMFRLGLMDLCIKTEPLGLTRYEECNF